MAKTAVEIAKERWEKAKADADAVLSRFLYIQSVLDNDPQKWSTTPLVIDGKTFPRQAVQNLADNTWQAYLPLEKAEKEAYANYKQQLDLLGDSEAIQKNPELVNLSIQALQNQGKALMQGTTKYLIWGAVAIVLIIGAIIIYKRKYAA